MRSFWPQYAHGEDARSKDHPHESRHPHTPLTLGKDPIRDEETTDLPAKGVATHCICLCGSKRLCE
jgi:hypothetical protein